MYYLNPINDMLCENNKTKRFSFQSELNGTLVDSPSVKVGVLSVETSVSFLYPGGGGRGSGTSGTSGTAFFISENRTRPLYLTTK